MKREIFDYAFWPADKIDNLFSGVIAKRISYKAFFLKMKKMYERAPREQFDIIDELGAFPVNRQYKLLKSVKIRKCQVRGKQNKEG
jgi:hypothetical protein